MKPNLPLVRGQGGVEDFCSFSPQKLHFCLISFEFMFTFKLRLITSEFVHFVNIYRDVLLLQWTESMSYLHAYEKHR